MELTKTLPKPPEEYEKQVYQIETEDYETETNEEYKRTIKSDTPLGDTYDLFDLTTRVHSPIQEITRDFTLSDLSSEVISNKLPKFIREQIKTMRVVEQYIVVPKEELLRKYTPEEANRINTRLKIIAKDIKELMLNEIYSMVIMSRSVSGNILKAILLHGKSTGEREEFDAAMRQTTMDKLKEERK